MTYFILFRMLERVIGVLIGGLAIFLGYRLFLKIPVRTNANGQLVLGGLKVVLSRAGPGVFFALYGATIVGVSFFKPIKFDVFGESGRPISEFMGASSSTNDAGEEAHQDARMLLQREIQALNHLPSQLKSNLAAEDRNLALVEIARIKFELMDPVWDKQWGDKARFKQWVDSNEPDPPPAGLEKAVAYFRYGK
jgi:hypothetical protein